MPRDASGTYTPPSNSFFPAQADVDIDPNDWNETIQDLAAAISGSLMADLSNIGLIIDLQLGAGAFEDQSASSFKYALANMGANGAAGAPNNTLNAQLTIYQDGVNAYAENRAGTFQALSLRNNQDTVGVLGQATFGAGITNVAEGSASGGTFEGHGDPAGTGPINGVEASAFTFAGNEFAFALDPFGQTAAASSGAMGVTNLWGISSYTEGYGRNSSFFAMGPNYAGGWFYGGILRSVYATYLQMELPKAGAVGLRFSNDANWGTTMVTPAVTTFLRYDSVEANANLDEYLSCNPSDVLNLAKGLPECIVWGGGSPRVTTSVTGVGFNGADPVGRPTLPVALATDGSASSAALSTLANALRAALISNGLAQ